MYIEEIAQMIIDPVANWLWDNYLNKWVTLIADALPSVLLPSFEPLQAPMKALFERPPMLTKASSIMDGS